MPQVGYCHVATSIRLVTAAAIPQTVVDAEPAHISSNVVLQGEVVPHPPGKTMDSFLFYYQADDLARAMDAP